MATSKPPKPNSTKRKGPTWDQLTEKEKIAVDAMFTWIVRMNRKYQHLREGNTP